jgi:hypothetical protein
VLWQEPKVRDPRNAFQRDTYQLSAERILSLEIVSRKKE